MGKTNKRFQVSFLDEPLTSLDINYQQEFLQIAGGFTKEDTIMIAVMHDINLAVQYADKLFFLKEGKLIAHGNPREILNEGLIKNVFNINTSIINNPLTNSPLVVYNNILTN